MSAPAAYFSGKRIYVFATSGGSGIGKSGEKRKPSEIVDARLLRSADEAADWVRQA